MKQSQQINTVMKEEPPLGTETSNLKNIPAYHEIVTRKGLCLSSLSCAMINGNMITLIYTGKVYQLRQIDVVYRECTRAPVKMVLVVKFHGYLAPLGISSGIDMSKRNFPDKRWLILAIATLSKGQDGIFDEDYMPV